MKKIDPLHGLVAAPYTPFKPDGSLNLDAIERQAEYLLADGVTTVFINGTTAECASLSVEERLALAQRWFEVARGTILRISVHVGTNSLPDAQVLAANAERLGVISVSAFSPSYFKPCDLDTLIDWCAEIASAAPETPFYFYDIPAFTNVSFSMPDFLEHASKRIPTLAGLKFSNPNLMAYQLCLNYDGGRFDVPYGIDEWLLAALALGAKGTVGSTYNFAAPLYQRMWAAFTSGDLPTARKEQLRAVRLVQVLNKYGYMGAAKAVMTMIGVDVGKPRLPNRALTNEQIRQLRGDLETLGFFDWRHV